MAARPRCRGRAWLGADPRVSFEAPRADQSPRPVVPGTRVPVAPVVDPVQAVVEEEIRTQPRRIIDGVARHGDQLRKHRQVDPDAHAGKSDADTHLGNGRSRRPEQYPQREQSFAHLRSSSSEPETTPIPEVPMSVTAQTGTTSLGSVPCFSQENSMPSTRAEISYRSWGLALCATGALLSATAAGAANRGGLPEAQRI